MSQEPTKSGPLRGQQIAAISPDLLADMKLMAADPEGHSKADLAIMLAIAVMHLEQKDGLLRKLSQRINEAVRRGQLFKAMKRLAAVKPQGHA